MMLWITASPQLLMERHALSPQAFGLYQTPVFAGFILGAQMIRFFMKISSRPSLIYGGIGIAGLGALGMIFYVIYPHNFFWLILSMTIYSIGFGICAAPLTKETFLATDEAKGLVTALFFLIMSIAGVLLSALASLLPMTPTLIALFLIALSLLSFFFFWKRNRD